MEQREYGTPSKFVANNQRVVITMKRAEMHGRGMHAA
jgi:hypothetical protein